MGTDYSNGTGIVINIETLVNIINGKNKKAVIKAIREWIGEGYDGGSIFEDLADNITIGDLKAKLIAQCEIAGEAGKYEGDCHLVHTEDYSLCGLWNDIILASGTDIPLIEDVTVFDSYRQHMECPIGEASFIFSRDDIYESKLNDEGEALQKLCGGYLNEVTWTDVSY